MSHQGRWISGQREKSSYYYVSAKPAVYGGLRVSRALFPITYSLAAIDGEGVGNRKRAVHPIPGINAKPSDVILHRMDRGLTLPSDRTCSTHKTKPTIKNTWALHLKIISQYRSNTLDQMFGIGGYRQGTSAGLPQTKLNLTQTTQFLTLCFAGYINNFS